MCGELEYASKSDMEAACWILNSNKICESYGAMVYEHLWTVMKMQKNTIQINYEMYVSAQKTHVVQEYVMLNSALYIRRWALVRWRVNQDGGPRAETFSSRRNLLCGDWH